MAGHSEACSGNPLIDLESQGDYCQCKIDSQKRQTIVPFPSCEPRSLFDSRPLVVHIHSLSLGLPSPQPLHQGISPLNPPRNVALVTERMPGVCPAGAVASKRTGACRSASPAWTVGSSTASRRATVPPPAMQCVETACLGKGTLTPIPKNNSAVPCHDINSLIIPGTALKLLTA